MQEKSSILFHLFRNAMASTLHITQQFLLSVLVSLASLPRRLSLPSGPFRSPYFSRISSRFFSLSAARFSCCSCLLALEAASSSSHLRASFAEIPEFWLESSSLEPKPRLFSAELNLFDTIAFVNGFILAPDTPYESLANINFRSPFCFDSFCTRPSGIQIGVWAELIFDSFQSQRKRIVWRVISGHRTYFWCTSLIHLFDILSPLHECCTRLIGYRSDPSDNPTWHPVGDHTTCCFVCEFWSEPSCFTDSIELPMNTGTVKESRSDSTTSDIEVISANELSAPCEPDSPVLVSERTDSLSQEKWLKFMDSDGRVVHELELRRNIFKGQTLWQTPHLYCPWKCGNYTVLFLLEVVTALSTGNPTRGEGEGGGGGVGGDWKEGGGEALRQPSTDLSLLSTTAYLHITHTNSTPILCINPL